MCCSILDIRMTYMLCGGLPCSYNTLGKLAVLLHVL